MDVPGFDGFSEKTPSNLKGLHAFCRMCPDLMDFPKNTVKFEGFAYVSALSFAAVTSRLDSSPGVKT